MLHTEDATALVGRLRSRELGSVELLHHQLARIEAVDQDLHAVVTLDAERALAEAARADEEAAAGRWRGPLHGLPMTVKDSFETAGLRTTSGAPALADHVPETDAVAVARLKAAGAIVFGKTNLPLYADDLQSYNELFATTCNPWDRSRTPGGSSGGAAAAVAAGLSPLELGSDIGGSIRTPAHFCGVFGHKPSHGLVPLRGHVPPPPGSVRSADVAVAGPLARSARDLRLALDVLAGPDAHAAHAWRLQLPPPRRQSLDEYRIAVWLDDDPVPLDDAVATCLREAVAALRDAGARVDEHARPDLDAGEAFRLYLQLLWGEGANGPPQRVFDRLVDRAAELDDDQHDFDALLLRGMTQRKRDWNRADEARQRQRDAWTAFFARYDVLLCPAAPVAAFPHDHTPKMVERTLTVSGRQRPYLEALAWAGVIGMALLPGTVVPVGRTDDGLPVGLQVCSGFLDDATTLDVAERVAAVTGGFVAPPGL